MDGNSPLCKCLIQGIHRPADSPPCDWIPAVHAGMTGFNHLCITMSASAWEPIWTLCVYSPQERLNYVPTLGSVGTVNVGNSYNPIQSSPHRNADDIAPLPDLLVVQSVDGFVFPHRASAGGGERGGVGGVGFGVDGHKDEAVAVTPVHPYFDCTGLALGPQNHRMPRLDLHIQYRLPGCRVDHMGCADDPQILPDGSGELFKGFQRCSSRSALPLSSLGR